MTKDSRLRTVQREYGKVFVVVFGVKYRQPANSKLKIGDDVMVVEGSTMDAVTFRRVKDNHVESGWLSIGYIGGEKAKPKAIADWEKFVAGEKSIGMSKEKPASKPKLTVGHLLAAKAAPAADVTVDPLADLARDHEAVEVYDAQVVRFRDRDLAGSFRLALHRRGQKADDTLTDENSGEAVVVVRSK